MRLLAVLATMSFLVLPGCLGDAPLKARDEASPALGTPTEASYNAPRTTANAGQPASTPSPAPSTPKPQTPVDINESADELFGAVHRNWSWTVEPTAKRVYVEVSFAGYKGGPARSGDMHYTLVAPSRTSDGGSSGVTVALGPGNEAGGLLLDLNGVGPNAAGVWSLRLDSGRLIAWSDGVETEENGSFTGQWHVRVRVE